MTTREAIQIFNWARAELQDADERGDTVSRIDALKRVKTVLDALDLEIKERK